MRSDPVVSAFELWKKRVIGFFMLVTTTILFTVVLLFEAHALHTAWEFVQWSTQQPRGRDNDARRQGW